MYFLGVCFGYQFFCCFFGVEVWFLLKGDWELGYFKIELMFIGQKFFWMDDDYVYLYQMYQDYVVVFFMVEFVQGLLFKGMRVYVWGKLDYIEV